MISQPRFEGGAARVTFVTAPFNTGPFHANVNARSRSTATLTCGSALNDSLNVNGVVPLCSAGTLPNDAVNGAASFTSRCSFLRARDSQRGRRKRDARRPSPMPARFAPRTSKS